MSRLKILKYNLGPLNLTIPRLFFQASLPFYFLPDFYHIWKATMNRAIKSSRSSYHFVPNANLCTLCKSREITIVSCKDSEDEEFLWRCNTCRGFQLQRITPTKRTNLSRAGGVEAEVPSGPALEMSEAEMNLLLDESDDDSSSEESEYECDCNNMDCDETCCHACFHKLLTTGM